MVISSQALYRRVYQALLPTIQEPQECQAITYELLRHYFQLDPAHLVMGIFVSLSLPPKKLLDAVIARIKKQEPLQYILGKAHFLGRDFCVNPSVLIPRPETEELVQRIIEVHKEPGLRVLDLGTGSGCIAITLQQELYRAIVHALDIDPEALRTAQINAQRLGAALHWMQADMLKESLPDQCWDIIVSNPPYVRWSERTQMHARVVAYEPSKALFVPDQDPLLFHERIVSLASNHLDVGGKLYLEINEALGQEAATLLSHAGFQEVTVMQDLHGKDRWVEGIFLRRAHTPTS